MKPVAISVKASLASITNATHIYPATFADTGHNYVGLNKKEGTADLVQIDSVGSFANRIEEQLAGLGVLPAITIQVGKRSLSIHELPHRIYDAIMRDAELDGIPWRHSALGQQINMSNMRNATALYSHAPLTLLLGGWDSHGGEAGTGTKIARSVACEIWGHGVKTARHCAQRIDPLGITSDAKKHSLENGILTPDENGKKPAELGHGDVPSGVEKGVFVERIELTGAISLTRLERYQFPDENGQFKESRNAAAREVLKQLALVGIARAMDELDLRSGCELYATERKFALIAADGTQSLIDVTSGTDKLVTAIKQAEVEGLVFAQPITLTAGKALEKLAEKRVL